MQILFALKMIFFPFSIKYCRYLSNERETFWMFGWYHHWVKHVKLILVLRPYFHVSVPYFF